MLWLDHISFLDLESDCVHAGVGNSDYLTNSVMKLGIHFFLTRLVSTNAVEAVIIYSKMFSETDNHPMAISVLFRTNYIGALSPLSNDANSFLRKLGGPDNLILEV